MNLRELYNKTICAAATSKVDAQLAKVSTRLSAFSASLPETLDKHMKKAAAGRSLTDYDKLMLTLEIELKDINVYEVQAALEKCPGYQKLVSTCQSPGIDMGFRVWVSEGWKGKETTLVRFSINPEQPFSQGSLKPHIDQRRSGIGRTIQ